MDYAIETRLILFMNEKEFEKAKNIFEKINDIYWINENEFEIDPYNIYILVEEGMINKETYEEISQYNDITSILVTKK